ncbi:uncharacterized protein LOC122293613 [Carya illinoinensis]|uniref:uncharacterized protein LOC122293613 n=1 Tax=Carya illinoinensis TaxID=32201 RepID=UPI001C7227BB|nr:uncharacterized protein LOC122293613 [Carya illinoinensis]
MKLADGEVLESPKAVHDGAVRYFKTFLTGARPNGEACLDDLILPIISEEENLELCRAPTEIDVQSAVLSIPKNSSPGLDGFGSEVLSRLIKKNFADGKIGAFHHPRGVRLISHLLYADDLLMFVNGKKRSIRMLIKTLKHYEEWSGRLINKEKSSIFLSKLIGFARRQSLLRLTGFVDGVFPTTYLGAPLVTGHLKAWTLEPLITKIQHKVAGWKFNLLSQGGRLVLIKHVLSSRASHQLAVLDIPNLLFTKINAMLSSFFWGGKRKWRSRYNICKPTCEGGLGIRDFVEVKKSLQMKFAWRMMTMEN